MTAEEPIIPADNRILFYKRDRAQFGFLSNFHPAPIVIDGVTYATSEHYYQSQKSHHPDYVAAIMAAPTPGAAKRWSADPARPRKVSKDSWFRRHNEQPRADWNEVKVDIMRRALHAKFSQHADLAARLIATADAEIIEDSRFDSFWGIGEGGGGANQLGRLLMELRAELRSQSVQ